MARVKGSAPIKAVEIEAEEQVVSIETTRETMAVEAKGAEEAVHEAAASESAEATHGNILVEIVKSGATKAEGAINSIVPAVGGNLRTVAYNGIFYISFGVTFGALVVARLVPADSFVGKAIADGAEAAKAAFKQQQAKVAPVEMASSLNPTAM